MRSLVRIFSLFVVIPGLLLLVGCQKAEEEVVVAPVTEGEEGAPVGPDGEPVIVDTAYIVVEKRQTGGELVPGGKSKLSSTRPAMTRTDLESMIIVEGNQTKARSAYLLPPNDYNVVQVGHHLQESTLSRWQSTSEDHIPPPPPPPEGATQRSRTGGAAENYVY